MNSFDKARMDELASVDALESIVHFPFFANTFSLPFHYANRLERARRAKIVERIREHKWEMGLPTLVPKRVNVFYATTATRRGSARALKEAGWKLYHRVFTHYVAGFIFIKPQLSFLDEAVFSKNFVEKLNKYRVRRIELLTDIPKQSKAIKRKLTDWGFKGGVRTIQKPIDALFDISFQENTLKLYFYGAPATTHMRNNRFDYQALKVADEDMVPDEHTRTEICLAIPENITLLHSECEQTVEQLKVYHDAIFKISEEKQDHTRLFSVVLAYNQYAERMQHSAIFSDTEQFAQCLREHHRPI